MLLAVSDSVGAASSQKAGDQPRLASRSGSGVRPNNTMPQASQVAAARVNGSGWRAIRGYMTVPGGGGEASLLGPRLTDRDTVRTLTLAR